MTVEELVTQWWKSVDVSIDCEASQRGRCHTNCANCFYQWSCLGTIKSAREEQRDLELKIAGLVGHDIRVFVVSETQCVVSYWDEDDFNHFLDICTLEKGLKL